MVIAVLDAFADAGGNGGSGDPGSFTVSSGSNRYLVAFQHSAGTTDTVVLSWGGQALTQREAIVSTGGFPSRMKIWTLDEAGIAAASGSDFSTTGTANGDYHLTAVSLSGVDQASPVVDTGTSLRNGAATSIDDIVLTTVADGYAAAGLMWDDSGVPAPVTWSAPFTERVDLITQSGSNRYSSSDLLTTAASATASADTGGDEQQAMAAISFRAAVVSDRAVGASTSTGTATATPSDRAVGASTSTGSVTETKVKFAQATGASISTGVARETKLIPASTSSSERVTPEGDERVTPEGDERVSGSNVNTSVSGSRADAVVANLVSATGASTSVGNANASEFTGLQATGASVSGGRANASPPLPIIPPTPLKDSFLQVQRPVFLVDLFFDSAEVNIWTRPNVGEFGQKEYQPLAGITSGITIRNSLDSGSFDASIQLSGQSQEILNIALTENYRNRRANIYLGNIGDDGEIEAVENIFPGTIVNMPVTDTAEESTVSIVIESIFRTLARPEIRRQSSADLALVSDDDSFFNFTESTEVNEPTFGGA